MQKIPSILKLCTIAKQLAKIIVKKMDRELFSLIFSSSC